MESEAPLKDITSFQGLSYSFYLTETERRHHREERKRKTDRGRQTVTNYNGDDIVKTGGGSFKWVHFPWLSTKTQLLL